MSRRSASSARPASPAPAIQWPPQDVGRTFATANAPIFRVLERVNDTKASEELKGYVDGPAHSVPYVDHASSSTLDPAVVVSQVLDIDYNNAVSAAATLKVRDLGRSPDGFEAVTTFVQALRTCPPTTHTRQLILARTRPAPRLVRLLKLFFAHVLLVEMGLHVDETLWFLECVVGSPSGKKRPHRFIPGLLAFGDLGDNNFGVVKWLGKCKVGDFDPHLGVISPSNPSAYFARCPYRFERSASPQRVVPPSSLPRSNYQMLPIGAGEYFATKLDARHTPLRPGEKLSDDKNLPGHWLAALLQLQYWHTLSQLSSLEDDEIFKAGASLKPDMDYTIRIWMRYATFTQIVEFDLSQLDVMRNMIPDLRTDDCNDVRKIYEDLLRATQARTGFWNAQLEGVSRRIGYTASQKQIEVAQLSVEESRSAIALTVLALAFVPISLAASIFGMNIQEINHSGHSIWAFVITSVVLTVISTWVWLARRIVRKVVHSSSSPILVTLTTAALGVAWDSVKGRMLKWWR